MKKRKQKKIVKGIVGGLATVIAMSSSALATDYSNMEKSVLAGETIEYVEYAEPTVEIPYMVMDLNLLNRVTQLTWTVLPNNRLESVALYIEAGSHLNIVGTGEPENVAFKFGYTDHNTDWYCMGQDSYGYTFTVEKSGYYHIYFRNMSTLRSVTVSFMYAVNTP